MECNSQLISGRKAVPSPFATNAGLSRTGITWLVLLMAVMIFSCEEEPSAAVCPDPLGAHPEVVEVTAKVQVLLYGDLYAVPYQFICFKELVNDCFGFDVANEPAMIRAFYIPAEGHTYGSIIDVGEKACLREITEKPSEGFSYSVPLRLRHGYVVKKSSGHFARFFVDSWETDEDGRITHINIVRQYAF